MNASKNSEGNMTTDERIAKAAKEYAKSVPRTSLQEAMAREDFLAGAALGREIGREEQRERDAKICDAAVERNLHGDGSNTSPEDIAAAIRADE